jgi:hypothetical protein
MNKLIRSSLFILFITTGFAAHSQVLMKDMLTKDQKGMLDKSVNWPVRNFTTCLSTTAFVLTSLRRTRRTAYYYTLMIADNAGMNNAIKIPADDP